MRRYLVVGNQTLQSDRLLREMRACVAEGPCRFHVVVPATPPHEHAFWTEGQAIAIARDRLDAALGRFHAEGLLATGDVGDANPVEAVSDVLRHEQFDEVIVSTLPPGLSRWIHQDLPRRLERKVELPVRHVIVPFDDLAPVGGRLEDAPR